MKHPLNKRRIRPGEYWLKNRLSSLVCLPSIYLTEVEIICAYIQRFYSLEALLIRHILIIFSLISWKKRLIFGKNRLILVKKTQKPDPNLRKYQAAVVDNLHLFYWQLEPLSTKLIHPLSPLHPADKGWPVIIRNIGPADGGPLRLAGNEIWIWQ